MNEQQLRAVRSRAATICVVAGPGSGKTHTLTQRILCREEERPHQSSRIILTFTNAGAIELAARLRGVPADFIGTLHGYCFRLLQRHGERIGYRAGGVNLIGEDDAEELLKEVAKEMGWGKKSMKALRLRDSGAAEQIWLEYEHRLKRDNMVDYDGVLHAAAKLFVFPGVRTAEEVDEIYVDEAQDSAEIDWLIYTRIPALTKFVVGDPDQGIFAFRGAWPEGLRDFSIAAKECVLLERNYRSGHRICQAASALIACNSNRLPKAVLPALDFPGQVVVKQFESDNRERSFIVSEVRRLIDDDTKPEEIAVLCRRNKESGSVADFTAELTNAGIPVAAARQNAPIDTAAWRFGIDVLRLFHDPRSDLIAARVIERVAGPQKLRAAKSQKTMTGRWLSDEAVRMGALPLTTNDFIDTLANVPFTMARWGVDEEMIDVVQKRIALLPQADARLQDLLHDLFDHEKWVPGAGATGVTVTTMHGSKGREFPIVFLPAFEDGMIPTLRKDAKPEDLEEERRLAFVAMTRAKYELRISWAASRFAWGHTTQPQPSRFIAEAGLL